MRDYGLWGLGGREGGVIEARAELAAAACQSHADDGRGGSDDCRDLSGCEALPGGQQEDLALALWQAGEPFGESVSTIGLGRSGGDGVVELFRGALNQHVV
jgi:hypothetical protein